jgi:hypothetical protein
MPAERVVAELPRHPEQGWFMKRPRHEEVNDIPFVKNELGDSPGTMDKPLDTSDAPGKADSELVEDGLPPRKSTANAPQVNGLVT